MPIVVGIRVRKTKDKICADAGHLDLAVDAVVLVETDNSQEVGVIVDPERMIEKPDGDVYKVIRMITPEDYRRIADNCTKAAQALPAVKQSIGDHELHMKLTSIEYSFDRSKLFIYYTAETRVDFRELIKDLGHSLKTRIQMVQIGVRDEARLIGGMGPCGRELCCRSFLKDFSRVSIDMAKEQDIALNTAKISGLCSRLMCCLAYEHAYYCEVKKSLPAIDTVVKTPEGEGKITGINCLTQELTVDLGEGKLIRVSADQISQKQQGKSETRRLGD